MTECAEIFSLIFYNRCEGKGNAERIKHAKLMIELIKRLRESNEDGISEIDTIDDWKTDVSAQQVNGNGTKTR